MRDGHWQDSEEADEARDYGRAGERFHSDDADASVPLGPGSSDQGVGEEDGEAGDAVKYPAEQTKMAMSWQIRERLQTSRHVVAEPVALQQVILESVEFLQGHVLVCGCPSSIAIFVHTLRPTHIPLGEIMPIVFLHGFACILQKTYFKLNV